MKSDNATSGSSSGKTSETKPPPPTAPPEKLSESEYLQQQAQNAKLAMSKAWEQLKVRLGQGASPQVWAKEYPWITVGAAAVAGFVAASALIPSKEEQALKKLAAIERALNPHPPQAAPQNGNGNEKKGSKGIVGTILTEAIHLARPVLASLLTAGMAAPGMTPDGIDPQTGEPIDPQQSGGS